MNVQKHVVLDVKPLKVMLNVLVSEDGTMPCCTAKAAAACCCGDATCDGSCHGDADAAADSSW